MADKLPEPARGTALTLYNRFAELMLVVGLDENTGLVPVRRDSDSDDDDDIFHEEYEARVLAAISASKALVFHPYPIEDSTYPPSPESLAGMNSFETLRSKSEEQAPAHRSKKTVLSRPMSVNPAVIKQHLSNTETSASSSKSVTDLPLSKDAIENITTFCFPDNVRVYQEKPDNTIHFLVLTDVSGNKTYACCLTFYKPFKWTKTGRFTPWCPWERHFISISPLDSGVNEYLALEPGGLGRCLTGNQQ